MSTFHGTIGREVRARCGCALIRVAEHTIVTGGDIALTHSHVVVPCPGGEKHVELIRTVVDAVGSLADLDAIIVEFERLEAEVERSQDGGSE